MIKICYIITKLELGGAQKVALYTGANINKNIFESILITGVGGVLDDEASKKFKVFQLKNFAREVSPLKDLRALFCIYSILKREKPDIVHTHSSKAGILGRIAAKLAGIKVVLHTIHGYGFNETQKWYEKYLYVYLEKSCASISNKLIAVSKEDVQKGLKYKIAKESKYTLIRAGIDTEFYKNFNQNPNFRKSLGINNNIKVITTIGAFKPQKNLKDFVKAASIAFQSVKNVVFLIVGDGQERGELENLILNFNLKENILFLGWRTDIAEILKISDIFVLTSLWEGLPCTILEAMCCSKPVIANAVDGVKEIIVESKTGFLIELHNYKKTAEKIIYLLTNPSEIESMGKNALNSIGQEFNIDYTVKQHEELYLQLIKPDGNVKINFV
ncbi:MAG: glycosyltransferase family 4 protein [Endomicrobium sp.]|jgi:glycosyltransferase involved in cell wall biosynthesis|nr:glycosyltransferase family 4 protein [Endomicrobium sp.]